MSEQEAAPAEAPSTTESSNPDAGLEAILGAAKHTEAPAPKAAANSAKDDAVDAAAENADAREVASEDGERKFVVKIDGEDVEVSEDELLKGYSRGKASAKRFEEAARMRKEVEKVLEAMKDPSKIPLVLQQLGIDPMSVYQHWNQEVTSWEQMSDEEKQRYQFQTEKERFEAERQRFEEQRRHEQLSAAARREQERLTKEFNGAIQQRGLPQNARTIALMANYMEAALDNGHELSVDDAADLVAEEYGTLRKGALEGLSPDQVEQLLGKDWLDQLRKWDLSKLKDSQKEVKRIDPDLQQKLRDDKAKSAPRPRRPIVTLDDLSSVLDD